MMLLPMPPARRASLSYSIDKLSRRDEIVLKSTMRVLEHRFRHQWTCAQTGADVLVTTEAFGGLESHDMAVYLVCDVMVNNVALPLPLRAKDIETAFNRVGDTVRQFQDSRSPDSIEALHDGDEFRLRRWPANALLNTRQRLTLAAVLSVRPCSVRSLQRRSNLPIGTCRDFLLDLFLAGLLAPPHEPSSPRPFPRPPVEPPQSGLLARIRSRFGLLQSGWN
jgi:hypothetical protein